MVLRGSLLNLIPFRALFTSSFQQKSSLQKIRDVRLGLDCLEATLSLHFFFALFSIRLLVPDEQGKIRERAVPRLRSTLPWQLPVGRRVQPLSSALRCTPTV